ncbi:MAG: VWA domain-containing protein [Planctomycetota bacterium]
MRTFSICIAVLLLFCTGGWIVAQSSDGAAGGAKRPLDLPSGGNGDDDDEEDESESITFYGAEFEGDGFFWCLDRSCSMSWGGEIATLKIETTTAINQLSGQADMAIVAFSTNVTAWPTSEQPVRASLSNKTAANAFVQSLTATGGTCLGPGSVKAIEIAHKSGKRKRQILLLGDGVPYCSEAGSGAEVLAAIQTANYENISINTLYISAAAEGIPLFQDIASQNNGTFTVIE